MYHLEREYLELSHTITMKPGDSTMDDLFPLAMLRYKLHKNEDGKIHWTPMSEIKLNSSETDSQD